MREDFEFSFIVEGFDIDDPLLERLYSAFDDVGATDQLGRTTIEFVVEAVSPASALRDTLFRFQTAFPEVVVVRLDRDLVNVSEIADRISRTPESVRLLVNGSRGAGKFPVASGVLPGGTRIWEWAAVYKWLEQNSHTRWIRTNQSIFVQLRSLTATSLSTTVSSDEAR